MDSSDDDGENDRRKPEHNNDASPANKGNFVISGIEFRFPTSVLRLL